MADKPVVVRTYTPSQSAPQNTEALRHYIYRELLNIGNVIGNISSIVPVR